MCRSGRRQKSRAFNIFFPHFKVYLYTTFVPKCLSIRSANGEFEINVIFSIKFPTISMIPMSSLNLWGKKLIFLNKKKLFLSHCFADQTNILGRGGSTIFVSRTWMHGRELTIVWLFFFWLYITNQERMLEDDNRRLQCMLVCSYILSYW